MDSNRFFQFMVISVTVIFFGLLFAASRFLHADTIVSIYDNINASAGPIQVSCECVPIELTIRDVSCQARPLAYYNITGKVFAIRRYDTGGMFDKTDQKVNPFDVAIGWGPLLDDEIGRKLAYSMGTKTIKIRAVAGEFDHLRDYASNNHIILENDDYYQFFIGLKQGDTILLSGRLVDVECGGYSIETSLSRTDRASEAILVSHAEKIKEKSLEEPLIAS